MAKSDAKVMKKVVLLARNIVSLLAILGIAASLFLPLVNVSLTFGNDAMEDIAILLKEDLQDSPLTYGVNCIDTGKAAVLLGWKTIAGKDSESYQNLMRASYMSGGIDTTQVAEVALSFHQPAGVEVLFTLIYTLIAPIVAAVVALIALIEFLVYLRLPIEYKDKVSHLMKKLMGIVAPVLAFRTLLPNASFGTGAVIALIVLGVWAVGSGVLAWFDGSCHEGKKYIACAQVFAAIGLGVLAVFCIFCANYGVVDTLGDAMKNVSWYEWNAWTGEAVTISTDLWSFLYFVAFFLEHILLLAVSGMFGVLLMRLSCRGQRNRSGYLEDSHVFRAFLGVLFSVLPIGIAFGFNVTDELVDFDRFLGGNNLIPLILFAATALVLFLVEIVWSKVKDRV